MLREKENQGENGDFPNLIDNKIACAPLKGNSYEADRHIIPQTLVSFTTRQASEVWLKDNLRYRYGKRSMKVLRNQLIGEGNATSNIDKA